MADQQDPSAHHGTHSFMQMIVMIAAGSVRRMRSILRYMNACRL